jgi:DNA repair protein RadC
VAELAAVAEIARRALAQQMAERPVFDAPQAVKDYLGCNWPAARRRSSRCCSSTVQHRLIVLRELFQGTLTQTSVYPREVVKAALAHNAAAVILAHNHPSGVAEPSRADEYLTADAEERAGSGGRARAGPPGRGPRPGGVAGRTGAGVKAGS